jgi:hypothetical protein
VALFLVERVIRQPSTEESKSNPTRFISILVDGPQANGDRQHIADGIEEHGLIREY